MIRKYTYIQHQHGDLNCTGHSTDHLLLMRNINRCRHDFGMNYWKNENIICGNWLLANAIQFSIVEVWRHIVRT